MPALRFSVVEFASVNSRARTISFVKAHGLGNDFLLVEDVSVREQDWAALARALCDRHTGVGADGLVILNVASGGMSFRIFNSDGSEATLSGNALRCAAAWRLAREQDASPNREITFETRAGRRTLTFLGRDGAAWIFRAAMGRPGFAAAKVPFRPTGEMPAEPIIGFPLPIGEAAVPATILWMGNPQCILFVGDFQAVDWRALGAALERHPYFPDRANIGFVRVVDERRIAARFWERGAGYTLASGTGSCACVVAGHLNGKTGREVTVALERGDLQVRWRGDGEVELTGPAEIVAAGTFSWEG